MPAKEKYQANRGDNNQQASDSSKKTAKVAAKGAADYFTGGKGGAVVDKLADTKLGNEILNKAGKAIEDNPLLKKSAEELDKKGALDAADTGLSMMESGGKTGSSKGLSGNMNSKENGLNSDKAKETKSSMLDSNLEDGSLSGDDSLDNFTSLNSFKFLKTPKSKVIAIAIGSIIFFIFGLVSVISGSDDDGNDPDKIHGSKVSGACTYDIKGFNTGTTTIKKNLRVNDLKVRLMECDGSGPVANEELVDFEKYILGVTSQENGASNDSGIKAQAVAARSFSLARPAAMNNSAGTKLYQENGQWILQLRACTYDQAYCDPDRGCWSNGAGGEYGNTMHSGMDTSKNWYRGPIPQDAKIRTLVKETEGEVMVDNNGFIIQTGYKSGTQNTWTEYGKTLDYKQVLLQYYNGDVKLGVSDIIKVFCEDESANFSTGDFTNWKQCDSNWSSVPLGNSSLTVCKAGCLVTSVAMLIAKSGVQTTISDFNPGTFVQKLNSNSGFDGALFRWNVTSVAPSITEFSYINPTNMTRDEKFSTIKNLLEKGYYVVVEVKGGIGGTHWVAIDGISGNDIIMMDPSSSSKTNILWNEYKWERTSVIRYFKV